jgi:putative transposase
MRKTKFVNGEYYHVYNRGVDKRNVFLDRKDFIRFLKSIREFNRIDPIGSLYEKDYQEKQKSSFQLETGFHSKPKSIVEFICYCLNPNHYHFLLKQLEDRGIEKFMHKLGLGYTKYFNKKYSRSGALFQGRFKTIHIDSNEYLLWLSAYINANPKIHSAEENIEKYSWSSCHDYLGLRNGTLCNKGMILNQFDRDKYRYKDFIEKCIHEIKERKELQKYLME